MRIGTQQQQNNQDRYVNEVVPSRTWTLMGSVWCITLKFGHKLFLYVSVQLDDMLRSWKK